MIFEVLSQSTRGFDTVRKFMEYQKLDSLRHYVLIDQDQRLVAHHQKPEVDGGRWLTEILSAESDVLHLEAAAGLELPLSEIYAGVELEPDD